MDDVQASVGIKDGVQCYNLVPDQNLVMRLLDRVPTEQGGTFTPGGVNVWPEPIQGTCAPALHEAILEFQLANQAAGLFHDGHVDPGERTITLLNELATEPVDLGNLEEVLPTDGEHRFEVAPDGVLVPIPSEAPAGNPIRDDARITVSPRVNDQYYVSILNVPPDQGHGLELIVDGLMSLSIAQLEHLALEAARGAARGLIKFGGIAIHVLVSLFTPTPTLKQTYVDGAHMPDGTRIRYIVIELGE